MTQKLYIPRGKVLDEPLVMGRPRYQLCNRWGRVLATYHHHNPACWALSRALLRDVGVHLYDTQTSRRLSA